MAQPSPDQSVPIANESPLPANSFDNVPWHPLFAQLPYLTRVQAEEAFYRMAGTSITDAHRVAASEQQSPSKQPAKLNERITFESLPTIMAVLNLSLTAEDLEPFAREFAAKPCTDATPLPALEFEWKAVVSMYDFLVPSQNKTLGQFFALFSLLDPDGTGSIPLADLRHALCRSGPNPLTDNEFNHMLFRHRLLHKAAVSLFEYIRLLLDVPMPPVAAAVLNGIELEERRAAAAK